MRRSAAVASAVMVILSATACGTRLDHAAIVAANGGNGANGAAQGAGGGTGTGAAGTTTGGTVGGSGGITGPGGTGGTTTGGTTGGAAGTGTGPGAGHAGAATSKTAAQGAPIVLGNVGSYSGLTSTQEPARETLQVWAHYVNDHGGIKGHPVQLYTADDQGDPNRAYQQIKDMVENKHVLAFIGNQTSQTLSGYKQYIESKHIPVIGGDVNETDWNSSPVLFPEGAAIDYQLLSIPLLGHEAGKKNLAILYCAEADACKHVDTLLWNGGAQREGMTPVYHAQVSIAQPDFTSECLQAEQAHADALYIASDTNSVNRIAADCIRQGYHPLFLAGSSTLSSGLANNPQLNGMIGAQGILPWFLTDLTAAKQFHDAVKQYDPSMQLNNAAMQSWLSGKLFEAAAGAFGSGAVTRDQILQGLWALKGESLGGLSSPMTFVANKPTPPVKCVFAIKIENGQWVAPHGHNTTCVH